MIGYDDNMKENVESFFHLDYPNVRADYICFALWLKISRDYFCMYLQFELLFCIAETRNTSVQEFLRELMAKYPSVPATVYQGRAHCTPCFFFLLYFLLFFSLSPYYISVIFSLFTYIVFAGIYFNDEYKSTP